MVFGWARLVKRSCPRLASEFGVQSPITRLRARRLRSRSEVLFWFGTSTARCGSATGSSRRRTTAASNVAWCLRPALAASDRATAHIRLCHQLELVLPQIRSTNCRHSLPRRNRRVPASRRGRRPGNNADLRSDTDRSYVRLISMSRNARSPGKTAHGPRTHSPAGEASFPARSDW